ncbi:hypothetical protein Nepgr_012239 [Nepenthes gracilis]|uniref:MADS-box domain-containing protein n=1 Tax=Nepenthes gracilis TaxID=150966 RepID=A0AAD3SFN1_NEPGR|nr:hypothetical protein Nepgr_012239 [Nepenthes gracilis]
MVRKKVKLAYITDDFARKSCFRKRKQGLLKKMKEISILCDVEACAIIYSPYAAQPQVWPSTAAAAAVLAEFKGLPEEDQTKRMLNQRDFLLQMIRKVDEQVQKQRRDNREKVVVETMFHCLGGGSFHDLSTPDFDDVHKLVDKSLKDVLERVETLKTGTRKQPVIVEEEMMLPPLPPSLPPLPPMWPPELPPVLPQGLAAEQWAAGLVSVNLGMRATPPTPMQPPRGWWI